MQKGASYEELTAFIEKMLPHICHWFTVDDLNFLKKGGRISATTAVVGSILHIKPVLHVDDEGRLINVEKVRGRKAAIKALYDKIEANATDISSQIVMISHGDCYEEAAALAESIKQICIPGKC
jgi:DegV family protein with EDD domain